MNRSEANTYGYFMIQKHTSLKWESCLNIHIQSNNICMGWPRKRMQSAVSPTSNNRSKTHSVILVVGSLGCDHLVGFDFSS